MGDRGDCGEGGRGIENGATSIRLGVDRVSSVCGGGDKLSGGTGGMSYLRLLFGVVCFGRSVLLLSMFSPASCLVPSGSSASPPSLSRLPHPTSDIPFLRRRDDIDTDLSGFFSFL